MKALADAQKIQHGVIALSNVAAVDRTFSKLNNDFRSYLDMINSQFTNPPFFGTDMIAQIPTANELLVYGQGITVNDLIVPFTYDIQADKLLADNFQIAIVGFLIQENYMSFTQGRNHDVDILNFVEIQPGVLARDIRRQLAIEPTGPINSISQYLLLPVMMSSYVKKLELTNTFGGTPIPQFKSVERANGAFFSPYIYKSDKDDRVHGDGRLRSTVIVFKNQAGIPGVDFKVLPIYGNLNSARQIQEIFTS